MAPGAALTVAPPGVAAAAVSAPCRAAVSSVVPLPVAPNHRTSMAPPYCRSHRPGVDAVYPAGATTVPALSAAVDVDDQVNIPPPPSPGVAYPRRSATPTVVGFIARSPAIEDASMLMFVTETSAGFRPL